jgi:hypothetical protein
MRTTAAAGLAVLATLALCGVTPGEAARGVRHVLNADSVDGLSAARTPKPGRLLALDGHGRYPRAVLPQGVDVRGPRGAQGPQGPAGARGPSEAYLNRDDAAVGLPRGTPITIAELRLPAGAYALDFTAHTYLIGAWTFVDCTLESDHLLTHTAVVVGSAAESTIEADVAISDATELAADTTVRVRCDERDSETDVKMADARLRAIRVGALVVQ